MKRNSKNWYFKRGTSLREKNHDKKYRHSPGREKPTNGEFSAVHTHVYYTFVERCMFDDLVICRWFLYTAKAWNLSIAIPDIKLCCFKFASEGTNPRQRRIQWRWRRQKARREVWIGNSSCRQGWVSKISPVEKVTDNWQRKLCAFILLLRYPGKPFIQKCLKHRGLLVKDQEKTYW